MEIPELPCLSYGRPPRIENIRIQPDDTSNRLPDDKLVKAWAVDSQECPPQPLPIWAKNDEVVQRIAEAVGYDSGFLTPISPWSGGDKDHERNMTVRNNWLPLPSVTGTLEGRNTLHGSSCFQPNESNSRAPGVRRLGSSTRKGRETRRRGLGSVTKPIKASRRHGMQTRSQRPGKLHELNSNGRPTVYQRLPRWRDSPKYIGVQHAKITSLDPL